MTKEVIKTNLSINRREKCWSWSTLVQNLIKQEYLKNYSQVEAESWKHVLHYDKISGQTLIMRESNNLQHDYTFHGQVQVNLRNTSYCRQQARVMGFGQNKSVQKKSD